MGITNRQRGTQAFDKIEVEEIQFPNGAVQAGAPILHQATKLLSNADIIDLSGGNRIQIIAAPGEDRILVLVSGIAILDATGGAYGNVDPDLTFGFTLQQAESSWSNVFGNVAPWSWAFEDDSEINAAWFSPRHEGNGANAYTNTAWQPDFSSDIRNAPALIECVNGLAGALTDGDDTNSLRVSVAYLVFNTATGLFE